MLVIMKYGYVQLLPQPFLYVKTPGCGDVLQVDATETDGEVFHRFHNLVRVFGVQTDGPGVNAAQLFEQHGLPLHHGHGRRRAYVPQAQTSRTVGDDGDGVALDGQVIHRFRVVMNGHAYTGDTGGICHGQVVTGPDGAL